MDKVGDLCHTGLNVTMSAKENLTTVDQVDDDPWAVCNRSAENITKFTYESWKEELEKLLIFAGLFSAIVTTFAVEAGKTVQGDPADKTVLLLQTLILQANNLSNPQPNLAIELGPEVVITTTAEYINLFYSVSLSLSLVAVLGGIICLQWLREFSKNITGTTHRADLYLQYQRHESLRRWGVFGVLNTLTLLLIIALSLFFTGFLISLWESSKLAAIPVTILVGVAALFIVVTSCLPALQILWLASYRNPGITINDSTTIIPPPVLCPYRSTQAWLFHCMIRGISSIIYRLSAARLYPYYFRPFNKISNWTEYDIWWTEKHETSKSIMPAFHWLSKEYKQSQHVISATLRCFLLTLTETCRSCMQMVPHKSDGEMVCPESVWSAFGFSSLRTFQKHFTINSSPVVLKARFVAFSEVCEQLDNHHLMVDPTIQTRSGLSQLLNMTHPYEECINFLHAIHGVLDTNPINSMHIDKGASAAIGYMVDQMGFGIQGWMCSLLITVMVKMCNRYQRVSSFEQDRALQPIRQLCFKIQKTMGDSHSRCGSNMALRIFNGVIENVDLTLAESGNLGEPLGMLLMKCDECTIVQAHALQFLELLERLASKQEHQSGMARCSLSNIFTYTAHVMEKAESLTFILPQVQKTLKAILLAAENYVHMSDFPLEDSMFHPSKLFLKPPLYDWPNGNVLVSPVIEGFNAKLKEIWERNYNAEEGDREGGSGSNDVDIPLEGRLTLQVDSNVRFQNEIENHAMWLDDNTSREHHDNLNLVGKQKSKLSTDDTGTYGGESEIRSQDGWQAIEQNVVLGNNQGEDGAVLRSSEYDI